MVRNLMVQKVSGRGRVGYKVFYQGEEFSLVRSSARSERMYVVNRKLEPTALLGFKWFNDSTGELVGDK